MVLFLYFKSIIIHENLQFLIPTFITSVVYSSVIMYRLYPILSIYILHIHEIIGKYPDAHHHIYEDYI